MKKTLHRLGAETGTTAQKLAQPFTLPIRWIEGEKGATRRVLGEALGSTASLPFRLTGEVLKGLLRGGWSLAKLALAIPLIPGWKTEREAVTTATGRKLESLKTDHEEQRLAA